MKLRNARRLLVGIALLVLCAHARSSQETPTLAVDQVHRGAIEELDDVVDTPSLRKLYPGQDVLGDRFRFVAPEAGTYTVKLWSYDFDTHLVTRDETGNVIEERGEDVLWSQSVIEVVATAGQVYLLDAAALPDQTGIYWISVLPGPFELGNETEVVHTEIQDLSAATLWLEEQGSPERLAEALNLLAVNHWMNGSYTDAIRIGRQALDIREELLGPDDPETATSLGNLGLFYMAANQPAMAEPMYQRALKIRTETLGPRHELTLITLNNYATLCLEEARFEEAESMLLQVLEASDECFGPDHPNTASALLNVGFLYNAQGRHREALPLKERALQIRLAVHGSDSSKTAEAYNDVAGTYHRLARPDKAEPLYEEALRISENALGATSATTATILNNLASVYDMQGRHELAEPLDRRALQINREALGPRHPSLAHSLRMLANTLRFRRRYQEAEVCLQEALNILLDAPAPSELELAATYCDFAMVYQEQRRYEKAELLHRKGLSLYESTLGEEHPSLSRRVNNLGYLFELQGRHDEALDLYERAIRIGQATYGDHHPGTATQLTNLALLLEKSGQPRQSLTHLSRALRGRAVYLTHQLPVLSEQDRFRLAHENRAGLDHFLRIAESSAPDSPDILEHVWAWKGLVHRGLFRQRDALRNTTDPSLQSLCDRMSENQEQITALVSGTPPVPGTRSLAEDAALKVSMLEELKRKEHHLEVEIARALSDAGVRDRVPLSEVQACLSDDQAFLDFLFYRAANEIRLLAIVVMKQGSPGYHWLGRVRALDSATALESRSLTTRGVGLARSSHWLDPIGQEIWQPLKDSLASARRVFVSPDGSLGTVPFEAVSSVTQSDGKPVRRYLVEDYSFVYLQSPQDLFSKPPSAGDRSLLLVGDLEFDSPAIPGGPTSSQGRPARSPAHCTESEVPPSGEASSGQGEAIPTARPGRPSSSLKRNFAPIPGTGDEIRALAALHATHWPEDADPSILLVTGRHASKPFLKSVLPRFRYIHLATHGYFAPEGVLTVLDEIPAGREAEESSIALDAILPKIRSLVGQLPGHLSGIALSGANLRQEIPAMDGLLTSAEIEWIDLSRADLVVLSACETGLGVVRDGENMIGLRRALRFAGARTSITSLWRVDDADTAEFMTEYYTRLWSGESKVEALRNTQLAWIRRNRLLHDGDARPETWGAFILEGEW